MELWRQKDRCKLDRNLGYTASGAPYCGETEKSEAAQYTRPVPQQPRTVPEGQVVGLQP